MIISDLIKFLKEYPDYYDIYLVIDEHLLEEEDIKKLFNSPAIIIGEDIHKRIMSNEKFGLRDMIRSEIESEFEDKLTRELEYKCGNCSHKRNISKILKIVT